VGAPRAVLPGRPGAADHRGWGAADYFSATGQLWGNPLYRWDVLKATGYAWWIDRVRSTLATVDVARMDHFRGFEAYWEVPATEKTAIRGRWVKGPGADLFHALRIAFKVHNCRSLPKTWASSPLK